MKPISDQTIVITGASSGIGRETAARAGARGARVVLAARNAEALAHAAQEVVAGGGQAEVVPCDVAEWDQLQALGRRAEERFGGVDTWVNNAAVTEYAKVRDMTAEEMERIVRVNLLGQMLGARVALEVLERRGGGTIVHVSSALGRQAVPLQSAYVATKFGIVGFAESLRQELREEGSPVEVTTVLPPSVNTPFFLHARSKLGVLPRPVPPVYDPGVVADAILTAAEHPQREVVVGAAGKQIEAFGRFAPGVAERLLGSRALGHEQQRTDEPDDGRDNLFEPSYADAARGPFGRFALTVSPYTKLVEQNPALRAGARLTGAARERLRPLLQQRQ
jgi:short-subunit dehydrogenase